METATINQFPFELIIEILMKTNGKTVGACRRVCKKWKQIIDNTDWLWEKVCFKDYEHPSRIAKEKCHNECKWFHIYRNLATWDKVTKYDIKQREFHDFPLHEFTKSLTFGVDQHEINIPFLFERNCPKITNNDYALVIFFKFALVVVRPVENVEFVTERFYQADGYSLTGNNLYFYKNTEVFICDLLSKELDSKSFYNSDYKIKEIQHYNGKTFLFTNCGKIVTISKSNVYIQPINCPQEWIKQIKHICAINYRNYICYSRNLFKIETDKCRHLYLEFPPITALFFYGDFVLIGTKSGEILLYRLSDQKFASRPIFEFISQLPQGQYAVQLDVCERKSGPVIIVTTLFKIMFLEIVFFSDEKEEELPLSIKRLKMYKRLLSIRDALKMQEQSLLS